MKKKFLSVMIASTLAFTSSGILVSGKTSKEIKPSKDERAVSVVKTDLEKHKDIKNKKKNKGDDITNVVKEALNEEYMMRSFSFMNRMEDSAFNLSGTSFKIEKTQKDNNGKKHLRTQMFLDDIPVYGSELIIHMNEKDEVYSVNGKIDSKAKPQSFKKSIKLKKGEAIKKAEKQLKIKGKNKKDYHAEAKLYLYNIDGNLKPVYLVTISSIEPEASFWHVFVSAEDGKIVDKYNALAHGASSAKVKGIGGNGSERTLDAVLENGIYYLKDTTRPSKGQILTYDAYNTQYYSELPGYLVSDPDGVFNDERQKAAVDAHYNLGKVYDYYKDVLNRDSFDGKGASIINSVHGGYKFNNAFWNGTQMVFGDGDGQMFTNFASSLDITAHEFTHAVTQYTAGLEYRNESGALNEAFSDIIGIAIENKQNDWLIGEDSYTPNIEGDALRSMENPRLYNQPDHMRDYLYVNYDKGGVHFNSGIPNKAAYLMGKETGKETMAKIYYHALSNYLTRTSNFMDARDAVILSAIDLYGKDSKEHKLAINSWAKVGVGEGIVDEEGDNSKPGQEIKDTFEDNDTLEKAYGKLEFNKEYDSYISKEYDVDNFCFEVNEKGKVDITLTNLKGDINISLLNSKGEELVSENNKNVSSKRINFDLNEAGKYYIRLSGTGKVIQDPYRLKVNFQKTVVEDNRPAKWFYEDKSIKPIFNNETRSYKTQTITKKGAKSLALYFDNINAQYGVDYIRVKDKNGNVVEEFTGNYGSRTLTVEGDTATIEYTSNSVKTGQGYSIYAIAYLAAEEIK